MSVKSELGSGSTFSICVPVTETSNEELKRDELAVDKAAASLCSVLLVDDNIVICKMISELVLASLTPLLTARW